VLRAVAKNLGLEYEDVVADDEAMQAMLETANMQGPAQGMGLGANPDEARGDAAPPTKNSVSNISTV